MNVLGRGAVGATEDRPVLLEAVADHLAAAVGTNGSQSLYGSFEAIEGVMLARHHDLLCLPGSMFGPNQEEYLRLAFANVEAELMPEVAARLIESQRV